MNEGYNNQNLNKIPEQEKENKNILFENHKIELLSEEGAVEFSREHTEKIEKVLNLFSENGMNPMKRFSEFESTNNSNVIFYKTFPGNGRNISGHDGLWGVEFFNEGMDVDKAHRISSSEDSQEEGFVDNFSGTLAHELTHTGTAMELFDDRNFNREFIMDWREKFGWKYILPNIKNEKTGRWEKSNPVEGWEKNKDGKWQNGDYIVMKEEYTTMPEKCIGNERGYAASVDWQEDICDSVAAYLLNPSILNEEKREFLENKINEYKQNYKPNDQK